MTMKEMRIDFLYQGKRDFVMVRIHELETEANALNTFYKMVTVPHDQLFDVKVTEIKKRG